jgi:hypothetical protein
VLSGFRWFGVYVCFSAGDWGLGRILGYENEHDWDEKGGVGLHCGN